MDSSGPIHESSNDDERWLTVGELVEFAICSRAGLLAVETRDGSEAPARTQIVGDFPTPYTSEDIDRTLNERLNQVWRWKAAGAVILIGVIIFFVTDYLPGLLLTGGLLMAIGLKLREPMAAVRELVSLRGSIFFRQKVTLNPTAPDPQPIEWWGLLNAGWMSDPLHEAYQDETLGLMGRPWRVLRQGSFVLPVFKDRLDIEDSYRIRRTELRATACCELIRRCEGAQSPCAIVLHADTYRGLTIPCPPESTSEQIGRELVRARETLRAAQAGTDPLAPDISSCSECPWGRPRRASEETETICRGEPLPIYGTAIPGALVHSPCGDRYTWVPPHHDARQRELYGS